jgi:hypothetical protein
MRLSYTISADRRTLTVTAGKSARAELAELGQDIHSDKSLYEAFDALIGNSELQWVSPVVCGDLTEAPILGIWGDEQWVSEHKDGDGTILAGADHSRKEKPIMVQPVLERWAYMDYQIISPLQDLRDTGKAVFIAP